MTTVLTTDNKKIKVHRDVAALNSALHFEGRLVKVPVHSTIWLKIYEFNSWFYNCNTPELSDDDWNSVWLRKYFQVSDTQLHELRRAAQTLGNSLLLHTIIRRIAQIIEECDSSEQVSERFDLPNDLSKEPRCNIKRQLRIIPCTREADF